MTETIKTNVQVRKMFKQIRELAPGLAYETIEDFVDSALREKYERVLTYAAECKRAGLKDN